MVFSSIPFLYYYLPIVLLCYLLVPKRGKNLILFLASLMFYAWGEPRYLFLMLLSIVLGYIYGLLIGKQSDKKIAKAWVFVSCVTSLGFLGYYKYTDFFIENVNAVTGLSIPLLKLALPIGISFYTFQILSYTIDVYRQTVKPQKSFLRFGTYVSCFPQLIAGPIVRYQDIEEQLGDRQTTSSDAYLGLRRFVMGLSKKVLLANQFALLCELFASSDDKSILLYWLNAISYTLQIYFDFSGYSDMAIGLGRIFGFSFPENFQYPYISKTVTEFWRRWHMTLGGWFRDYVYIPLGGNRVSKGRWYFNIFVVWMLTGFWHGASWNFVLWGLLYAVLLVIEKIGLYKVLERVPSWVGHIYVMFFVTIGFVLFQNTDFGVLKQMFKGMFGIGDIPLWNQVTVYYTNSFAVLLILGVIGCTPLPKWLVERVSLKKALHPYWMVIEPIVICVLLILVTAQLVDGSFNPFLYFRF